MTKEERAELYKDSIGYECVEIDDTDDVGELMSWGEVVRDIKNSYIQGATEQEQITLNKVYHIITEQMGEPCGEALIKEIEKVFRSK